MYTPLHIRPVHWMNWDPSWKIVHNCSRAIIYFSILYLEFPNFKRLIFVIWFLKKGGNWNIFLYVCDNPPFCVLTSIWTTTFAAETAIPYSRRQLLSQWGIDKPIMFDHGVWRDFSIGWLSFSNFLPWKLLARCEEKIIWVVFGVRKNWKFFYGFCFCKNKF